MLAPIPTELQILWAVTAGILIIVMVSLAVASLRNESRSLMAGCALGTAILLVSGFMLFQGLTLPTLSLDREQMILMDIAVMLAAIIIGSIAAVRVMKSGVRRFRP